MKRIALIGNMNNSFWAITRYLRDAGYDAHLFFISEVDHFKPSADSFLPNEEYFHEVNWMRGHFHNIDEQALHKNLRDFEFFIGQGLAAAIAKKCGYNMDIYFPYGSDFYKYAWLPQHYTLKQIVFMVLTQNISFQELRRGTQAFYLRAVIKQAVNVFLDFTNPEYEEKLLAIGLEGNFENVPMPFLYLPQYLNEPSWDVHWKSTIDKVRANHDFVLVYHGRHEWLNTQKKYKEAFTTKNTHHLINGFAEFVKNNPNVKTALVTIEYGSDVVNSKKLIEKLGIGGSVFWLPKMYRKDVMYLLQNADLVGGQFDKSYVTFGSIIEAMAMGKPVVHYRDDNLYIQQYPELYPLFSARESDEITKALQHAYQYPEERLRKGKMAQDWVKEYFINRPMKRIVDVIEGSGKG